jgi:hypothetical protein
MHNPAACVIMAKQPLVGKTKTRLCPALTPQQAADLSEALLLDTITLVSQLPGIDLALAITPPSSKVYFAGITPTGTCLLPVEGENIGACLVQAFEALLGMGYRKALAINADSPSLPAQFILQAVDLLDQADLVLGPGEDGGYYLVGMSRLQPGIFAEIAWSTDRVLVQTLERSRQLGLSTALTPPWYDIDTVAELQRLNKDLRELPADRLSNTRRFLAGFNLEQG